MLSLTLVGEGIRGADLRPSVDLPAGQPSFSIGRDPACDWVLPDRSLAVSARHCEIVRSGANLLLRDHSTNGTFVNGAAARMAADHPLKDGDRFEVGPYTIEARLETQHLQHTSFQATAPLTAHERPLPPSPARPPAVDETAPLSIRPPRGRDPAAVAASRLPPEEADLTRIRPAPPAEPRAAAPAAPRAMPEVRRPATPPAPAAEPAADGPDEALRVGLAQALGLPVSALAGQDPARLLERVGALARASVDGLRGLLAAQASAQRAIGSRRPADWHAGPTLRLAASTDEALRALLAHPGSDPAAAVAASVRSLADHQARLAAAPGEALRRLGEDLAPDRLASALPTSDPAGQWAVYARLWPRLGLAADDAAWAEGFAAAGWMHLAAAYDRDDESPPA